MMMDTMESTSFYHDTGNTSMKKVMLKKSEMHLDFSNQSLMKAKQKKFSDAILNSPDVNLLKLASPELERMIIQQGAAITTTPTPTTQILFPRSVTEEQEAYARGFVDALAELHQGPEQVGENGETIIAELPQSSTYTTLTTLSSSVASTANQFTNAVSSGRVPVTNSLIKAMGGPTSSGYGYTTVTQLPGSVLSQNVPSAITTTVPSSSMAVNSQEIRIVNQPIPYNTSSGQHSQLMQIKNEEPQRVPSLSPQLTPINMVAQEGIKLERKRARNRVAARKCRTRKLERISRLEDRVNELKGQNGTLVTTASDLREQVFKLKQQILEHVDSGCKVMLSANML